MILYDYFRSSAGYRVRIALALKSLAAERRPIHLLRAGGEQKQNDYRRKNPQGLVPALELADGTVLTQSLAIIDYLDAIEPEPRLTPQDPIVAAKARAVALAIACDIHPLANLRVTRYLTAELKLDDAACAAWRLHWMTEGLAAIEKLIAPAPFCFGAQPTIADVCLVPQIYNARRFCLPLDDMPKILSVDAACAQLPAFRAAHPSVQRDAE